MVIKLIIIVIKITITVIMKIIIVLKLMKTVVQSHNPKTYICSNSDNAQQEVSKTTSYRPHCRSKYNAAGVPKQRPSNTFFNIKTKGSYIF